MGKSSSGSLRSQRHEERQRSGDGSSSKKKRSSDKRQKLSVKEQIALKAQKPLVQGRQFKFISPAARMRSLDVDLARVRSRAETLAKEDETSTQQTLFGTALESTTLLNLSRPFVTFWRKTEKISKSLPLVVHHRDEIVDALCEGLRAPPGDLLLVGETLLEFIPPLVTDLSTLLVPRLPDLLATLVALTSALPSLTLDQTRVIERAYDALAVVMRDLGSEAVSQKVLEPKEENVAWQVVRRALGAPGEAKKETEDVEMQVQEEEQVANEEEAAAEESADDSDAEDDEVLAPTPRAPSPPPDFTLLPVSFRTTTQTRRLFASALAFVVRAATSSSSTDLIQAIAIDLARVESAERDEEASNGVMASSRRKRRGKVMDYGARATYAEGFAWVILEACSAPNNLLHSRTGAIARKAAKAALRLAVSESAQAPSLALQHALVGLAHHVSTSTAFEDIVQPLVGALEKEVKGSTALEEAKVSVIAQTLETVMAVRGGARISDDVRPALFALLARLHAQSTALESGALTQATVVGLRFARLQDALSASCRDIANAALDEETLADDSDAFARAAALVHALIDANATSALDALVLPRAYALLDKCAGDEGVLLRLAGALAARGLERVSASGRKKLADTCLAVIAAWSNGARSSTATGALFDALAVATAISAQRDALRQAVSQLLLQLADGTTRQEALDSFNDSPFNVPMVASQLLRTLVQLDGEVDASLIGGLLEPFGFHRCVLVECAAAVKMHEVKLVESFGLLLPNLLCEDADVRGSTLRMLAPLFSHTTASRELVQKTLEAEDVAMSVEGAREKGIKLRRIGTTAKKHLDDEAVTEDLSQVLQVVTRYLVAMLRVNFKPLWSEAIAALALIADKAGETLWPVARQELVRAATKDNALRICASPEWSDADDDSAEGDLIVTTELRCCKLNDARAQARRCLQSSDPTQDASESAEETASVQLSSERLIVPHYESQLLQLLGSVAILAQRHSRDFSDVFLAAFTRTEESSGESHKERKQRLVAWLGLYSKFTGPRSLYRSEDLHSFFERTLAYPDTTVQRASLECLVRWKSAAITANADRLRNILEQSKLRDELLQVVSGEEAGGVAETHRAEVMPLFIRIVYGLMTSRQGRSSAGSGQGRSGRRAAILGSLRTCSQSELDVLIDLAISPFRPQLDASDELVLSQAPDVALNRQNGFLGLLLDILKHLARHIVHRWHDLLRVVINILHHANATIMAQTSAAEVVQDEDEDQEEDEDESPTRSPLPVLRRLRQLAFKRLADFVKTDLEFDFAPYIGAIVPSDVTPRLAKLPAENAQAPSAMFELLASWSLRRDTLSYYVDYDAGILPAIFGCLSVRNAKPAVIHRVLDVISSLVAFADEDGGVASMVGREIISPSLDSLLTNLSAILSSHLDLMGRGKTLGQRLVSVLTTLTPYIDAQSHAEAFLALLVPLLRKSSKGTPERVRIDLLKTTAALVPIAKLSPSAELFDDLFGATSTLFSTVQSRNGRIQLAAALASIAAIDASLATAASILVDLNSFSKTRSEEPDFDRRLDAYSKLNEQLYAQLPRRMWAAVLHDALFHVRDDQELVIRSSASFTLRRLIQVAADQPAEYKDLVEKTLMAGIRTSLRAQSDAVRAEVLSVLSFAVEQLDAFPDLAQLKCLLVGGDSEANFFNNIQHVQTHRRTRALRRLADEVEAGNVAGKIISDLFTPLLDHFLLDTNESKNAELANEAISCLGRLCARLGWTPYSKIAYHYLRLARKTAPQQRLCIRALVAVLRGFHLDEATESKVLAIVSERLLPSLLAFLEQRDEQNEEMRIPVAEGIAALINKLPDGMRHAPTVGLLMNLSSILRSFAQSVRDQARQALCNITALMGGEVFPTVIKELRSALQRGPQLHVLAFTVHAILLRVTSADHTTTVDVDGALPDLAPLLGEDVFGAPNKERMTPEFRAKTKFREVKTFKSLDSFQIVASVISPSRISSLLGPVRNTLQSTDNDKMIELADDVLRRIANGIVQNPRVEPTTLLELSYDLLAGNSAFLRVTRVAKEKKAAKDYRVQLQRDEELEADYLPQNAHHFISLGLDLFMLAYGKSQFDFDSPEVLSRLDPLIESVANTLFAEQPPVALRAMKAIAALVRCPLPSFSNAAPVIVRQLLAVVGDAGGTESELALGSLRALAAIIRECKAASLTERQLTSLLELIGPDLEETERQSVLFQLLRAIMSRKFVAPEIYDLMDRVAEILVTNQSSHVREICRAIYLQFLLDYPHGRGRLRSSLMFLVKNLAYEHESGRLSVLELTGAIINKFAVSLLQEVSEAFFVGLVMVVANDESSQCREGAAELVKRLMTRLGPDARRLHFSMLEKWSAQSKQPQLQRTSVQLLGVVVETFDQSEHQLVETVYQRAQALLIKSSELFDGEGSNKDWQLPYQALQTVAKVCKANESLVATQDARSFDMWAGVRRLLLHKHTWVRSSAARLVGTLFAAYASGAAFDEARHPLSRDSLLQVAQNTCSQLKSDVLDEQLALQLVKNMFALGRIFSEMSVEPASESDDEEESDGDEDGGADEDDGDQSLDKEEEAGTKTPNSRDPLRWLMTRLSFQARTAHRKRPSVYVAASRKWSLQPSSILRFFAAMISHLDAVVLERFLPQVVTPLYRITEDPNSQDPQMEELQALAHEVQEVLTTKIGTTAYAAAHSRVRQAQNQRRIERKREQAIEAVKHPEKEAERRVKRNEQKTRSKKRKAAHFADTKLRYGQTGRKKSRQD